MKSKLVPVLLSITVLAACSKGSNSSSKPAPLANFTFSAVANNQRAPATFSFSSTSTNADVFLWNFGNGSSGSGLSTSHKYTTAGTYTVILTANGGGGTNTRSQNIIILPAYTQIKIGKIFLSSGGSQTGTFTGYFKITNSNGTAELWNSGNLNFPGTYPTSYTVPTPYVFSNLGATYQIELWRYNTIGADTKLSNTAFIPGLFNLGNTAVDSYPTSIPAVNAFSSFDVTWQ